MKLSPYIVPVITMSLVTTALTSIILSHENSNEIKTLYSGRITKENSVHLKGTITNDNINEVIDTISKNNIKFLLITSGGGDTDAGMHLVNLLKTRQDIVCIADYAASMAFTIIQNCGVRLATETSYFMTHKAYIDPMYAAIYRITPEMINEVEKDNIMFAKMNSDRMGISYLFYTYKLEQGDWQFTNKRDIVYYHVVDGFYPNKISTFEWR